MDKIMQQAVSLYEQTQSIKATARHMGIAEASVKKILISAGVYETARSREIADLYQSGKSILEIAEELGVSAGCVLCYLPYTRGSRLTPSDTINAQRIRECRARKKA